MTTVRLTADRLQVRLSLAEKLGSLHGDLDIARTEISAANVVADGLAASRGLRAPGVEIPGRVKLGTWRGRSGRQFVAVRRGEPTLRLELAGGPYDTVLISTPDAAALAAALGTA